MRHERRKVPIAAAVLLALFLLPACQAAFGKDAGPAVDSGTFSVMVDGKRVATETFSIHQDSSGSLIHSEFTAEQTGEGAVQASNYELTPAGELRKYSWKEIRPGKAQFSVVPEKDFLMERYASAPQEKEGEQPFLLPNSTSVLDDYSYVQREVLAWKYLASGCRSEKGVVECPLHQKTMYGTLNPHARSSAPVSMEYAGREKVAIRGAERELIRLDLKSESGDWALWLDDQFKLLRVVVPAEKVEVVRD